MKALFRRRSRNTATRPNVKTAMKRTENSRPGTVIKSPIRSRCYTQEEQRRDQRTVGEHRRKSFRVNSSVRRRFGLVGWVHESVCNWSDGRDVFGRVRGFVIERRRDGEEG